jgi:hypothetical protein
MNKQTENVETNRRNDVGSGDLLGRMAFGTSVRQPITEPMAPDLAAKCWDRIVMRGDGNQPPKYLDVAQFYQQEIDRKCGEDSHNRDHQQTGGQQLCQSKPNPHERGLEIRQCPQSNMSVPSKRIGLFSRLASLVSTLICNKRASYNGGVMPPNVES